MACTHAPRPRKSLAAISAVTVAAATAVAVAAVGPRLRRTFSTRKRFVKVVASAPTPATGSSIFDIPLLYLVAFYRSPVCPPTTAQQPLSQRAEYYNRERAVACKIYRERFFELFIHLCCIYTCYAKLECSCTHRCIGITAGEHANRCNDEEAPVHVWHIRTYVAISSCLYVHRQKSISRELSEGEKMNCGAMKKQQQQQQTGSKEYHNPIKFVSYRPVHARGS
uniref:Secreted protein n=1 Tax=Trichogramma kaykai TaxID=54128 RepID=A0ABD2WPN9_9HYME